MIKKKKEINYGATRFKSCPFNEEQNKETLQSLAHSQNRALEGKIGIDGKELSLLDTPQVNGYSFVKTPSPMPGIILFSKCICYMEKPYLKISGWITNVSCNTY